MPTPSGPEAEAVATVRAFLQTWTRPGLQVVEQALSYIAEDFTGLGTGPGDYYPDRPTFSTLLRRERAQMPDAPVSFDLSWVQARLLRSDLALIECQIRSEVIVDGAPYLVDPRCSFLLEHRGQRWLIVHLHFSESDAMQEEGDTLLDALERRNRILEREVAQRTAELEQSLADLKAAQARLVQSEKMASLGALTAGIAHEIKNPLNFVNNFAALARELVEELAEETDPEALQTILADLKMSAEKIELYGQRADDIVGAMLEHAREGNSKRDSIDLNALVAEHMKLAWHGKHAQRSDIAVELTTDLDEAVGQVEVVADEIGRVVFNLVSNALDAVCERSAHLDGAYAARVKVSTRRRKKHVEIRVADNGAGISTEIRDRIFEPFFTTKPPGSGTGLGLSLSYDIVTQGHGGELTAESKENQGATFIVSLPTQ